MKAIGPRLRRAAAGDDGFSLAESLVALTIMSVIFTALGIATLTSVKATATSRVTQQSGDLLAQSVEAVRALPFTQIANKPAEVAGQPGVSGTTPNFSYTPPGGVSEPVAVDTVGGVTHLSTVVRNNVSFTVRRYVTKPADATGATTRRLTVVVSWQADGQTKTKNVSTKIVETERGLPLPRFRFQATPTVRQVNPQTQADFGLRLDNLGARDAFDIVPSAGTWTFYLDTNKDGARQVSETTTLGSVDGDATPDTGYLEPNGSLWIVASRVLAAGETTPQTYTFTATSIAQPSAPTAIGATSAVTLQIVNGPITGGGSSPTPTATATSTPTTPPAGSPVVSPNPVAAASCTSSTCQVLALALDQSADGNVSSAATNPLRQGTATYQSALNNYSTEFGAGAGRVVTRPGTGTSTQQVADWRYSVPNNASHPAGNVVITVWVKCVTAGATVDLLGTVGYIIKNTTAVAGSTSGTSRITNCSATDFTKVEIGIANTTVVPEKDTLLAQVRLVSGSTSDVRLAYDTATYPASLAIGRIG